MKNNIYKIVTIHIKLDTRGDTIKITNVSLSWCHLLN